MNHAQIWWRQVGSSLRLCQAVVHRACGETSFVLYLPRSLPWQDEFYDIMKDRLSSLRGDRTVNFLDCTGEDPGRQVLQELCAEDVRTRYWPGQSYADYLGGQTDITLNQMYVWVRGIRTAGQLDSWRTFAARYDGAARAAGGLHALFLLEYRTDHPRADGGVVYTPSGADCQVFCLEAAALQPCPSADYLACLAQSVSGGDPELAGALIRQGDPFLQEPEACARRLLDGGCSDSGQPFAPAGDETLHLRVWRAQIMVLFARVEEKRLEYIRANLDRLSGWMPVQAENGALIRDPWDLEFGNLFFLTRRGDTDFTRQETEMIRLCRDVRNLLAHNELVPYDKVSLLLSE